MKKLVAVFLLFIAIVLVIQLNHNGIVGRKYVATKAIKCEDTIALSYPDIINLGFVDKPVYANISYVKIDWKKQDFHQGICMLLFQYPCQGVTDTLYYEFANSREDSNSIPFLNLENAVFLLYKGNATLQVFIDSSEYFAFIVDIKNAIEIGDNHLEYYAIPTTRLDSNGIQMSHLPVNLEISKAVNEGNYDLTIHGDTITHWKGRSYGQVDLSDTIAYVDLSRGRIYFLHNKGYIETL